MPPIFLEETTSEGRYRLGMIDRAQIAVAEAPGQLGNVFECHSIHRTRADDAQILYTLASAINVFQPGTVVALNTWSITVTNANEPNLFAAVAPLTLPDREQLYRHPLSITCETTTSSSSPSLFSLVVFAQANTWKSGILQRCVDCLVQPQHRSKPAVYAVLDHYYWHIMRVHLERTPDILTQPSTLSVEMKGSIHAVQTLVSKLGLRDSVDTTTFTLPSDTRVEDIRKIIGAWSGSEIVPVEGGYRLRPQANVLRGLSYLQPWLPLPAHLTVMETAF